MSKWRWVKLPKGLTNGVETYFRVKIRDDWKQDVALVLLLGIFGLILYQVFF